MPERERDSEFGGETNAGRAGEWLTANQVLPLAWPPWYLSRLEQIEGAMWVWPVVQEVCELPNPAAFPWFDLHLESSEWAMLERYVSTADRLIATTVMNSGAALRIDLLSGAVEKAVPADDVTVGFSALLRQMFKGTEEASFDRVRNTLSKVAHAAGAENACLVLGAWKRTHQTLRKKHLRLLMHELAREAGLVPTEHDDGGRRIGTVEEVAPEKLLEVFLHGDMLHWGEGRDLLDRWAQTERGAAEMELQMRSDANVLAHFYAGFSGIVQEALRRQATSDRQEAARSGSN
jgi:hypothetical protein